MTRLTVPSSWSSILRHPDGLGQCLGQSQKVGNDFLLMLVAALEEIQPQRYDGILGSLIEAEHAHSVLLGTIAKQLLDLEENRKLVLRKSDDKTLPPALTLSHGVGLIWDRTRARLCTVLSKQNLLVIPIFHFFARPRNCSRKT